MAESRSREKYGRSRKQSGSRPEAIAQFKAALRDLMIQKSLKHQIKQKHYNHCQTVISGYLTKKSMTIAIPHTGSGFITNSSKFRSITHPTPFVNLKQVRPQFIWRKHVCDTVLYNQ